MNLIFSSVICLLVLHFVKSSISALANYSMQYTIRIFLNADLACPAKSLFNCCFNQTCTSDVDECCIYCD